MLKNILQKLTLALVLSLFVLAACSAKSSNNKTWYIDQKQGNNEHSGLEPKQALADFQFLLDNKHLNPGDLILIMGEYKNPNYGDGDIWKKENSIKINDLHGESNNYIAIKPYDQKTVLRGDGSSIIRITKSSFLRIEGFNIYGEVENISLATALENQFIYKDKNGQIKRRVPEGLTNEQIAELKLPILKDISRPSYTDSKGIYVSNSDHIEIVANHIQYMPGAGLRVAKSDYIDIIANEINDCSRRSYSGTHALVIHSSKSMDNNEGYKIKILRNKVHHNYNEIYSWSPKKTFITPHIDEGKGISLQKNSYDNGWKHGRFLVANNLSYWNGFSGLHNNGGERIDFINNTVYFNSYTNSITNDGEGGGKNIGISSSGGRDIKIINNIVETDTNLAGFTISIAGSKELLIANNLLWGKQDPDVKEIQKRTLEARANFKEPDKNDFNLQANSAAIDSADVNYAPKVDYYNNKRDAKPDIGAIELSTNK